MGALRLGAFAFHILRINQELGDAWRRIHFILAVNQQGISGITQGWALNVADSLIVDGVGGMLLMLRVNHDF